MKSCFTCQFFTHDTIEITNESNTLYFQIELSIFAISKFRFKNDNSFYSLLLLHLGDIILNSGPFSNHQLFKQEEWQAFSNRGLDLIHLSINSLLPKIDDFRDIAKRTKAAVIGMLESKLDGTILDPEIYIYILHLHFTFTFYIYILHFTFTFYIYILHLYLHLHFHLHLQFTKLRNSSFR